MGIFTLSLLNKKKNSSKNIGLYRDDRLSVLTNIGEQAEKYKKKLKKSKFFQS